MSAHCSVSSFTLRTFAVPLTIVLLTIAGCSSKPKPPESATSAPAQQSTSAPTPPATPANLETTDAESANQTTALALPKNFGHFKGDWDEILKRGTLRVLTVNNRSGFFYDKGRPRGGNVELLEEFEIIINKKLKAGPKKLKVVYLPMPPGQLLGALNDGIGDIACTGIIITPEREKLVDFTVPLFNDVKLVVVTSKTAPAISSVDDLSGKDVYINTATVAKQNSIS